MTRSNSSWVVCEELQALVDLEGVAEIRGGTVCQNLGVCYLWKHLEPLLPLLRVPILLGWNQILLWRI